MKRLYMLLVLLIPACSSSQCVEGCDAYIDNNHEFMTCAITCSRAIPNYMDILIYKELVAIEKKCKNN